MEAAGAQREAFVLPDGDEGYHAAMDLAATILARRAHSRAELTRKLATRHDDVVIERVLVRLTELGLVDDDAFAAAWVAERSPRKGGRALAHELTVKGIEREVIERALSEAEFDEVEPATALAVAHLRRVSGRSVAAQARAIGQMLSRRGFHDEVVTEALRAVLPPEGWD